MDAAEKHGFRAGKDIAIVGIDDIPASSFSKLSLTSVKQPYSTIAKEAIDLIVQYISQGITKVLHKEFQPELKKRNSTMLHKAFS
jgi:DNA-binding LacI/PurR family transcriptional regulator